MFLRRVENAVGLGEAELTVCLVSDAEIARMNEEFRKKKGPTDVLSFPSEQTKRRVASAKKIRSARKTPSVSSYLGDIAIAPQTARRYAKKNGRTLHSELRVLILHGVLHLMGYDHETDRGEMNRIEQKLRRRFGLA